MKKIKLFTLILLSASVFLQFSCGESNSGKTDGKDTISNADSIDLTENADGKVPDILYSLPAPVDIASVLIDHPGSKFNREMLNPIKNVSKYNTNKSMAINLGIYSADLSYASIFEQTQISMDYMAVTKNIAQKLGIANIIDESKLEMINAKKLDKDAMQKLISETFMNTDAYLKEAGRQELMSMILVGGWLEAQYIATTLSKGSLTENPELVSRIMEQSLTLELMIMLFDESKEDENLASMKVELVKIKEAYDKINQAEPTAENYKAFCEVIKQIRNGYTA